MTNKKKLIGIDSQCITYLIQGLSNEYCPFDLLSDEKRALVRIFFYYYIPFYVPETVERECKRIADEKKCYIHQSLIDCSLFQMPPVDSKDLINLANNFFEHHKGKKTLDDCKILAECELGGLDILLTLDTEILTRLKTQTKKISIMKPNKFWEQLNIPLGTKPFSVPLSGHPLENATWWRI